MKNQNKDKEISKNYNVDTDNASVYTSLVIKNVDSNYQMWYARYDGSHERIHYATSSDGITWTKHGVVVDVGTSGETDNYYVYTPSVIKNSSNDYQMWYSGNDGSHERIHYATSTDGIVWTKHGVVIDLGASGETDDYNTYAPTVIKNVDGDYQMWYDGYDGDNWRIHHATSSDGITWIKHGVVVDADTSGETDGLHAYVPIIIKNTEDDC